MKDELDWLFDHIHLFSDEEGCYEAWCEAYDYDDNHRTRIRWAMLLSDYEDAQASIAADRKYALMKEGY